jgi:hypothetical protein
MSEITVAELADKIAEKLRHPVFQGLEWETYDAYLPIKIIRPTGVTSWLVRTPDGREHCISGEAMEGCITLQDAIIPPAANREVVS